MSFRRHLWSLINKLVAHQYVTKSVMRRVLGCICFCLQYRRELYSLLHHLYKWVDDMPDSDWRRIPGFVCDELRAVSLHLPFAVWHMQQHLDTTLLATDATPTSGGATTAEVPEKIGRALVRHSEVKGEAGRLDGDMPEHCRMIPCSKDIDQLAEGLQWQVKSAYHFRQTSHVNLQELRAVRRELVQLTTSSQCKGKQLQVLLCDSRVCVGALGKGRSSSFKLNGVLRSTLPFLVCGSVSLCTVWVGTNSNPADAPSQGKPLPVPKPLPAWAVSALPS
jgi:hypothetical protein